MPLQIVDSALYTNRPTVAALVSDFPADECLVGGLRGMQAYYVTRNGSVDIPVLRVMNTAHLIAAYLFNTQDWSVSMCDRIAYELSGGDRMQTAIVLIVLAEMLARTTGNKAHGCRSALLEQRSDDFYEGMSLYEQFLADDEAHFSEEDFLIDLMDNINILRAENERLKQQLNQQNQTTMQTTQPQTIINMQGGTYIAGIDIHGNEHCNIYACPQKEHAEQATPTAEKQAEDIESVDTSFFCTQQFAPDIIEKNIRQAIDDAKSKADVCRKIMQLDTCGYILIRNVSDDKKAALMNPFTEPRYTLCGDDFVKARSRSRS